ncbi:MAG TPA: tetratricopeptide repeat protein [Longimicrobium sp.]|nr:tetratricopeptide repeat protein [Longimicrobium sp.]
MAARRRSESDLPHAPLELLHPVMLPGAEIPGAEILGEIGGSEAATLLGLLRAVLAWSANPGHVAALDRDTLERTEYTLLSRGPDGFASPAGLLAGYMARPKTASERDVAWVCICISDWAAERGARATAIQFAMAAAFAWPRHPRYAWIVARMLIESGRRTEAEAWLRRSWRVAVWTDDWEAQGRSINALGMLHYERGTLRRAERLYRRAITVAKRHVLPEIEAIGQHNLFVVKAEQGDRIAAETAAASAFALYGYRHPKLLELVADVAFFWNRVGLHARALRILYPLLQCFNDPDARLRLLAGVIRAAGIDGCPGLVEQYWPELWFLSTSLPAAEVKGSALYEAGIGARALGDNTKAELAFKSAVDIANRCGANQLLIQAEQAFSATTEATGGASYARRQEAASDPGEQLAEEFLKTLRRVNGEETGVSSPSDPSIPAAEEDSPSLFADLHAVARRSGAGCRGAART